MVFAAPILALSAAVLLAGGADAAVPRSASRRAPVESCAAQANCLKVDERCKVLDNGDKVPEVCISWGSVKDASGNELCTKFDGSSATISHVCVDGDAPALPPAAPAPMMLSEDTPHAGVVYSNEGPNRDQTPGSLDKFPDWMPGYFACTTNITSDGYARFGIKDGNNDAGCGTWAGDFASGLGSGSCVDENSGGLTGYDDCVGGNPSECLWRIKSTITCSPDLTDCPESECTLENTPGSACGVLDMPQAAQAAYLALPDLDKLCQPLVWQPESEGSCTMVCGVKQKPTGAECVDSASMASAIQTIGLDADCLVGRCSATGQCTLYEPATTSCSKLSATIDGEVVELNDQCNRGKCGNPADATQQGRCIIDTKFEGRFCDDRTLEEVTNGDLPSFCNPKKCNNGQCVATPWCGTEDPCNPFNDHCVEPKKPECTTEYFCGRECETCTPREGQEPLCDDPNQTCPAPADCGGSAFGLMAGADPALTCFDQLGINNQNRWGWLNVLKFEKSKLGSVETPIKVEFTSNLYVGAGQCDTTKGVNVGDATITLELVPSISAPATKPGKKEPSTAVVVGDNTSVQVTVTYNLLSTSGLGEAHSNVVINPSTVLDGLPRDRNNMPTVAPGQYNVVPCNILTGTTAECKTTINMPGFDNDLATAEYSVYWIVHAGKVCKPM